ncbi:MAG: hypothetical protein WC809_21285 [Sinimarinibacterium sp.]|jgi:hypothetical protein
MMAIKKAGLAAVAAAVFVAGCGDDSDSSGAFCDSIAGGGSQLTSECTGCTVSREGAAADGNLSSAAEVIPDAVSPSITASIRASARDGAVFPAGNLAGVFFTGYTTCENCTVTISTYLDGALQESGSGLTTYDVDGRGSPASIFSGVETTRPFDAVEIVDSGTTTPGNGPVALQVFEICSNGGVRD